MTNKNPPETEQEFKETKEDLEDLIAYIRDLNFFLPIAVSNISSAGKIIDVNRTFEVLSCYQTSEILGKPLADIFLEKEEIEKMLNIAAEKEFRTSEELTLIRKQKDKISVNIAISSKKDREGNLIGYFVGITDISKLKKLQEELEKKVRERTKELQGRVEELEKFHQLTVGRELKMVELKDEVKILREKLEKYEVSNI